MANAIDYTKVCFVIMPFGEKRVGDRDVNFDPIYKDIFEPAIAAVPLPEGGFLVPKRTDHDFFTGHISVEMFRYIEYSRFALADISGLNVNVFYELGARHRARESGTAIFRQADAPIPFDINQIKAFPYEYEPIEKVAESKTLITRVLTESLLTNRIDSPIQTVLAIQQIAPQQIQDLLREAEDAIRNMDRPTAIERYSQMAKLQPSNALAHFKHGLLLKEEGRWAEALPQFTTALQFQTNYSEAWRERGIAENKLYWKNSPSAGPTGQSSLKKAIELNPQDFDALSSLGGVLKRDKKYKESAEMYRRATDVSHGHPYPLLNEIKVRAHINGSFTLDPTRRFQLIRAEPSLQKQANNDPPYNPPWSCFDLAEIHLYLENSQKFLSYLDRGVLYSTHSWQPKTFRDSLRLLVEANISIQGLDEGLSRLESAIKQLPN